MSEREHLEDLRIDGRIILRWIFGTWNVLCVCGLDLSD